MYYVHPAWEEHQRKRWTRHDAHRWLKPTYEPKAKAAPQPVRHEDYERELEALQREHFRLKSMLIDLRIALLRRDLVRKYRADQPRVPAGNSDGGQWTNEGGGGARNNSASRNDGNDSRIISDAAPDDLWKPGAQYTQSESQRRYSVNLREEEAHGGHTLRDHVGKSDQLIATVRDDRGQAGIYRYARERHGSFPSSESANDFVNRTLERNQELVDRVARGDAAKAFLQERFGHKTGREAFRPSIDADPYLRDTYEVGVDIRHEPRAARGFRVHTAYPRNSRRR